MERNKKIELKSEKVQNIIGQVPPILLRYGISIIGLSLLILVGVSAFIPYQPSIDVEINVSQNNDGVIRFSTHIPKSAMKNRSRFNEVVIIPQPELPLPTHFKIESVSDTVEIHGKDVWQTATLRTTENNSENILLENPIKLQGKILFKKQSVMKWIFGKIIRKQ